ncbi:MAG: hypothetical protein U5K38_07595 [Woeseiaceae bacterium]|nr:hypothetical protein [Woeseiaceae bacterium]
MTAKNPNPKYFKICITAALLTISAGFTAAQTQTADGSKKNKNVTAETEVEEEENLSSLRIWYGCDRLTN